MVYRLPTILVALVVALTGRVASSFVIAPRITPSTSRRLHLTPQRSTGGDSEESEVIRSSLEEKMAGWDATEEEIRKASLGGMVPQKKEGTDSFDIGLWIMFPFIVGTSLLFFVFPFIMDKIDVSSVGPPPMV